MKQHLSPKHRRQSKVSWKRRVVSFGYVQVREVDLNELCEVRGHKQGLKFLFDLEDSIQRSKGPSSKHIPIQLELRCLNAAESRNRLKRVKEQERSEK
jgi:hypothetical protein